MITLSHATRSHWCEMFRYSFASFPGNQRWRECSLYAALDELLSDLEAWFCTSELSRAVSVSQDKVGQSGYGTDRRFISWLVRTAR